MTGDFRRIVWTIAHLPASACTTSAPGSKSPLGRGGGGGAARIGVLPGFPVVGVRLCGAGQEGLDRLEGHELDSSGSTRSGRGRLPVEARRRRDRLGIGGKKDRATRSRGSSGGAHNHGL